MTVRIYKPSKSATQSGRARAEDWVVEYENDASLGVEPLMGWSSSESTEGQVRLNFDTQDDAIEYAKRKGLAYTLFAEQERKIKPRNYTDNFKYIPVDK